MKSDKENVIVPIRQYGYEQECLEGENGQDAQPTLQKPFDPKKINVSAVSLSMHSIITRLKANRIDMAPEFQRNSGIWSQKAKTRLIESLLIKLPLPAFYFDTTDDNRWVVIDGLQRLTTVKEYVVDNAWPLLVGDLEFLGDVCGGKRYNELSIDLQGNIEESQVMVCKILAGTPARLKFDIFRRINTGGAPLNSQEIRHALNPGSINDLLAEMVRLPEFLSATCEGFDSSRMIDRECVLRFLAFHENDPQKYQDPDFDRFLNDFMESFNKTHPRPLSNSSRDCINQLKKDFTSAMTRAEGLFGDDAFRKRFDMKDPRHPLNKALFEAWAVNLSKISDSEADILKQRGDLLKQKFIELMNQDDFLNAVTQGTSSVSRVKCRFESVQRIIRETINA